MFSFHRPKIFKSADGCCICKAKSSSSRFTCSAKYESAFVECFDLYNEDRSGDICNACVLLVKRFWKKNGNRNGQSWSHVVDARSGPGTRSMMRIRKNRMLNKNRNAQADEAEATDEAKAGTSSTTTVNDSSDEEQTCPVPSSSSSRSRRSKVMKDESNPIKVSPFLDMSFWRRKEICCGTIFVGAHGECAIDQSLINRCCNNKRSPSRASDGNSTDTGISCDTPSPQAMDTTDGPLDLQQHAF